jgi:hypothetical protein
MEIPVWKGFSGPFVGILIRKKAEKSRRSVTVADFLGKNPVVNGLERLGMAQTREPETKGCSL